MLGKAIYGRLQDVSGVTDLVEDRVYPDLAPGGVSQPYIVYELDDIDHGHTYSGDSGVKSRRARVYCCSEDRAARANLADAVISALDGSGTWGEIVIQGSFLEGRTDGVIVGDATEQQVTQSTELEFLVWYEES